MLEASYAYKFRGNLEKFQDLNDHEIILAGPAETGKTLAVLQRLHQTALYHPIQALIVRKVHADLYSSVLKTFSGKIVHPESRVTVYGGEKPEWFDYPSGARIWVGGLDKASKVLSSEYDIIVVNQAEELSKEDWETLTTRATGRAGNYSFPAIWGDCNPAGSNHWILERANSKMLTLLDTTHKDNPILFDEVGLPTEQGRRTIASLGSLTGVRYKRLYKGLWVTPEGIIYDTFDRNIHVKARPRSEFAYWILSLDEGYRNPSVTLLIGVDSDLRIHIAREFYQSGILPSKHIKLTALWARQFKTSLIIVDAAAAGLIAELESYTGFEVQHSKGHVREGIGLVHEMLAVKGDNRPRLTIDPSCINTINEFESYVYKKGLEEPVKENDHALDSIRNFVWYAWGNEGNERTEVIYEPVRIGEW